ncbi:MAG: TatD family hydrolase [Bacillota bacterium]|nr:TatD family hydrolase [Bacillota bacterium]
MLFDSHSHFNNEDYTQQERQELLERIDEAVKDGQMSCAMDIGFNLESSIMAVEHAKAWPWCYAAVGCHPHDAKEMDDNKLNAISQLAREEKAVAIGEIGLDFHYDISPRDVQREWFRKQIRLANKLKMPIAIHAREADQEVMDILVEEGAFSNERKSWFPMRPDPEGFAGGKDGQSADARVLLHCFSGSAELGREYVKMGATLSVAGPVTYKNNKKTVGMVMAIPIEFLLIETDSPYLTPVPFRGKKNNPLYVEHVARRIAHIKNMDYEDVVKTTADNARRFYGIE